MSEHGTIYILYVILRFALEKNQTEIIYYILDKISGIEPKNILKLFNDPARANDLTNMKKIMTKYNINIFYYNDVIVNVIAAVNFIELERKNNYSNKLDTLKFLLQNYPKRFTILILLDLMDILLFFI